MVKSCCAVGCTNRFHKDCGLSFYRFPVDPDRRSRWLAAVKRENWQPKVSSWVCSAHFVSGKKDDDPLSPDYVPSIFIYVASPEKRRAKQRLERYKQRKEAKRRRLDSCRPLAAGALLEIGSSSDSELDPDSAKDGTQTDNFGMGDASTSCDPELDPVAEGHGIGVTNNLNMCDASTSTHHDWQCSVRNSTTMTDVSGCYIEALEEDCVQMTRKMVEASRTPDPWSQNSFKDNDRKVKFYTGLPSFQILMAIFNFVSVHVKYSSKKNVLTQFEEFIATLMKLRLGLFDQDLAYRFGVHQSTISRIFNRWIGAMNITLKPLIKWPRREELQKTLPLDFRVNFKKCIVIIDCFEIFCERPKPLMARAQTYSNYKHHNTVKFLIGIAPQGVITFISKGWGGRVSDQHLTVNCGILDHLLPGDQILADRGFNIQEAAGLYCAEVKLPPFTRGKKQLERVDVDLARRLSRVRIHVERVIGLLRQKYTLLESTLPINMIMSPENSDISVIDKIVTVCCALCNCCESVVPFE